MWALLAACSRPCPTFAELAVTDPDRAPDDVVERVRAAVDDFARWTGRDGVCVGEVRVVDEIVVDEDGREVLAGGKLDLADRVVRIDSGRVDVEGTVHHELCHALDYAEDLSWPNRAVFRDPTFEDVRAGAREDFADACNAGPGWLALPSVVPDCLADGWLAAFMAEEVWTAWEPGFRAGDLALDRRELVGLPGDGALAANPVAGPRGLFLAYLRGPALSFYRVDVQRAAMVERIEGPVLASGAEWALYGGGDDEDPLLVVAGERAQAWRLREGGLAPVPFPEDLVDLGDGVLADGALWLGGRDGVTRIDLGTLEESSLPAPDSYGAPDYRFARAGGGTIVAPWSLGRDRWQLARLSTADGAWALDAMPSPLIPIATVPLADGRVLVRWFAEIEDGDAAVGLGWFDPASGAWTVDAEVCGAHRMNFAGDLVQVGGRAWWFEWGDEDDFHAAAGLASIELPPR